MGRCEGSEHESKRRRIRVTTIDEDEELREALAEQDDQYDPELGMLETPFSGGPGYHTTLEDVETVHPTSGSLNYAVSLLGLEDPDADERAFTIIRKVLSLQDRDEDNDTYGIWPWYYEEPLEEMDPPDWNWADFCGERLVIAAGKHDRIPDDLADDIESSVRAACEAIIERDVDIGYTNIAIVGAFVTLRAGELYDWESVHEYGLDRLQRFADHTRRFDTFEEYNSPPYTTTAIRGLSTIETLSTTPEAVELSADLLDTAWKTIAEHFHPTTQQWAGPHFRAYSSLLGDGRRTFIQLGTDGAVQLVSDEEINYDPRLYWIDLKCPERYYEEFREPDEDWLFQPYQETETGVRKHASTYLTEEYCLGTFDKEVMWNQRRNLLAYLSNDGDPAYVHLRFLKDDYDYASAVFTSAHDRNAALFGIDFSTDGGDTHLHFDPTEGSIDCEDLRLRFEVGGAVGGTDVDIARHDDGTETASISFPDHEITARSLATELDWEPEGWTIDRTDEEIHVDYVLYEGDERTFDFTDIDRAALVFAFAVSDPSLVDAATRTDGDGTVGAALELSDSRLDLSIGTTPATEDELFEGNETDVER